MFKWRDSYSCKVKQIDEQHMRLFEIGRELNGIMSLKDEDDHYDEIMGVLKELKDYTIYHFDHEEGLMQKYNYAQLEKHKEEHRAFIEQILELESSNIDEEQHKVTMDILVFIANWIEKHIMKTDMQYSEYFNSKGLY